MKIAGSVNNSMVTASSTNQRLYCYNIGLWVVQYFSMTLWIKHVFLKTRLISYGLVQLLQDHIPLFHNLITCGESTLDGYDIMANNENPLFRIWMAFSLLEPLCWALFRWTVCVLTTPTFTATFQQWKTYFFKLLLGDLTDLHQTFHEASVGAPDQKKPKI